MSLLCSALYAKKGQGLNKGQGQGQVRIFSIICLADLSTIYEKETPVTEPLLIGHRTFIVSCPHTYIRVRSIKAVSLRIVIQLSRINITVVVVRIKTMTLIHTVSPPTQLRMIHPLTRVNT